MKVLFIATEAVPFAKSGGLGDVIGALPKALAKEGVETAVLLPLYETIKTIHFQEMEQIAEFELKLAWRGKYVGVYKLNVKGVPYYFIDNEEYFNRERYYGYFDDGERFAYFCKAALDAIPVLDFVPDILHLSEWQTALVPIYLKTVYAGWPKYERFKTVFTIHNIEYQGQFDPRILQDLFGIGEGYRGLLEYEGCINLMKSAIVSCDRLTTVSPTYAEELKFPFYAKGLDKIISENAYKLRGILNGIDERAFNPRFARYIATKYGQKTIDLKVVNKLALQSELGLTQDENIVMIGMVTRLVPHKGIDLLIRAFDEMMCEPVQFVMLASGEKQYEYFLFEKMQEYPDRVSIYSGFSDRRAQKIYAGADVFLMPSISEPCGLAQMIAMKYGTIPIVRETGGLSDSVQAYNSETGKGNGITFRQVNAHDMLGAIKRAVALYYDKPQWKKLMSNALKSDFSWKKGAREYIEIYKELETNNP